MHRIGTKAEPMSMYIGRMLLYFVITLTAFVFAMGWLLGNEDVVRVFPGFAGMVPTTALSLMLLGWALLDSATDHSRGLNGTTLAVAPAVAGIALLNLLISATGYANGIDNVLFFGVAAFRELKMASATAVCLMLGAVGLILLKARDERRQAIYIASATLGLLIAAIDLLGYVIDVKAFSPIDLFAGMAMHTAIAMMCLFSALLLLRADAGWLSLLWRRRSKGRA